MPCCDPPCWQSSNQSTFCVGGRMVRASYIGHVCCSLSWRLRPIVARQCCMTSGISSPASHCLGQLLPSVAPLYLSSTVLPRTHNVNLTNQSSTTSRQTAQRDTNQMLKGEKMHASLYITSLLSGTVYGLLQCNFVLHYHLFQLASIMIVIGCPIRSIP